MKSKLAVLFLLLLACVPVLAQHKEGTAKDKPRVEYRDVDTLAFPALTITQESVVDYSCIVNPGNPPLGKIRVYCDSGTGLLTCLSSTGTNVCPSGGGGGSAVGPAGTVQGSNGSGSFTQLGEVDDGTNFNVNRNFTPTGPNPYTDVTLHGVRAVNTGIAPAVPGITATINNGSSSASISSASTFQNGDGVTIWGAGPLCPLTTPVSVVVTPSIASAGTGTGLVVNGVTGATTYNYQVIARDKAGCYTAASTVSSTTTGAASLGSVSVNISGFTRALSVVTATTTSAHNLANGAMVYIVPTLSIDNMSFGGWYNATVVDSTHFTYVTNQLVANGAPSISNGGGVLTYFNANHVSWANVAGAYEYYIYGRTGGSLTLLGVSKPQSTANGLALDPTWDDFGSPMMDGISLPFFIPTTPPVSALLNDPLVTTIVSGAGTTTLILANTATASVSGQTILFDDGPTIAAAASACCSFKSLLYFPASATGSYVINSYTSISGEVSFSFAGSSLWLNDTLQVSSGQKFYGMLGAQSNSALSFGWPVGGFITANRANPGIYGANCNTCYWNGLSIGVQSNAGIGILMDDSSNSSWKFMDFSGPGLMSTPLIIRANDFLTDFDHIALVTPQGTNGTTATPGFLYSGGDIVLSNMSLSGRGIFKKDLAAGPGVDVWFDGNNRFQGGLMPFFTLYNGLNNEGVNITFHNVELDTMNHAMFSFLGPGGTTATVHFEGGYGPGANWSLTNTKLGPTFIGDTPTSSGFDTQAINKYSFTDNPVNVVGNGEFIYPIANSTGPGLALSSGGTTPVGTIYFGVSYVDLVGNEGLTTPYASIVTTPGNQTVTVTPAVVAGAVAFNVYESATPSGGARMNASPVSFPSYVASGSCNGCQSAPGVNRAGAQSISSQGISGSAFNLIGGGFKNTFTFTGTANRATAFPDAGGVVVIDTFAQTLSSKILSSPVINGTVSGTALQGTDSHLMSAGTVSGTGSALCTDANGGATTSGCPSSASFYQTVQVAGSSKTQEPKLNFIAGTNMTVSCVDNGGATSTDCTLTASNTGATAFSALTPSTNSTSGNFIATGNVWDYSGATVVLPVGVGLAPTASGRPGYDSTANKWVFGQNGATVSFGLSSSACASHTWVSTPATGTATASCTQPAFTDISGTITTAQEPSSTVNAVTNDTNVTGSIAGQTLTLGWTGTLAKSRALSTVVYTDQANIYSAGAQDFSSAASLKVPIGAGFAPTISGQTGYDSTANKFVFGQNGSTVSFGLAASAACASHNWVSTDATATAVAVCTQPAFTDISGVASAAQLPNPTASTLGGIESFAAVAHQWINAISTSGVPSSTAIGTNDISPDLYVAGGGTAQVQTATLSPAATSLVPGLQVYWLPVAANTGGAPTLNLNSLGAKSITKFGNSTPLVANDLTTNAIAFAVYDGTEWQLQNPQTSAAGSPPVFQTNGVNNVTQTSLNFISSTTNAIGGTITPSNPSGAQVIFELTGRITPFGGGTGLSNPTAHSLVVTEGSSNFNLVTSSSTNGFYVCGFNVSASAAVDPTCNLQGVPVNAQTGNYSMLYSDRANYVKESGGTTATLTLPQVTGNTASNFPFVTQNLNSGNETLTANAADKIDGSATGGSATLLPSFAAFIYQDSTAAPGNWWTIKFPTFAAFGSTCTNVLNWSTTTGFTCANASGAMFANFSAHQWLGNNTGGSAAPSPSLIGASDVSPNQYAPATGTAQAQVVALTPAVTALTVGTQIAFLPVANNTAANPSLAVNGLTAKSITKYGGSTNLVANDITTSAIAVVIYDGTQWELLNPQTAATLGAPCTTTGNSLQYDNAGSFGCVTPFTFLGSTITAASSGILDLSAETGASAFKIPVQAGATAASDGVVDYDSTAKLTHIRTNAADSIAAATTSTATTTTFGLFASSVAGIYTPRAIASGDLPLALQNGTTGTTQSAGDNTTDIATDAFVTTAVSNAIAGVNPAVAVLVATTGSNLTGTYVQVGGGIGDTFTITATGAFSLDGVALNTVGQRVLIKDQSTASQNGVYTVTVAGTTGVSPVFTRALDYDIPSDVNNSGIVPVQSGTANANTSWLLTSQVTSIGSSGSSLTYTQFSFAPSNIVTAAANFTNANLVQAAGANKTTSDSGIATANVVTAASNFTNADLVQAAGANKTTSDSGIATANVATAASAAGSSKQLAISGGANKTLSFITFPDTKYAPAADCVNAVAGSAWSTGATPAALCRAGTNNKGGLLSPWGASDVGYIQFHIPADADLSTQLPSLMLEVTTTESSTHTIIMQESVACAKEDGSTTDDVAFNAARSFATVTETSRANQVFDTTITLNSTDLTGCAAPGIMWVKISRTTDTATNVGVYGLNLTTYRLLTVQAN